VWLLRMRRQTTGDYQRDGRNEQASGGYGHDHQNSAAGSSLCGAGNYPGAVAVCECYTVLRSWWQNASP
jgi:hypothetical protein